MNDITIPYDTVPFSPEAVIIPDRIIDDYYLFDTHINVGSELVFHNHTYVTFYDPIKKTFMNLLISRNYIRYLKLNLEKLFYLSNSPRSMFSIGYRLILASMYSLREKHTYEITLNDLKTQLETNTKNRVILPWKIYQLAKTNTAFNMLNLEFKSISDVPHITFKHDGGIIETNNVEYVLKTVSSNESTLVVHPRYAVKYWNDLSKKFKLTLVNYHDLVMKIVTDNKSRKKGLVRSKSESTKFDSTYYTGLADRKNISEKIQDVIDTLPISTHVPNIILHECHVKILPLLKRFVKQLTKLNKTQIWIVNSLPLGYYYNAETTKRSGVSVSQLEAVINLWGNFTNLQRRMYKMSIGKSIVTDFHKFYSIVHVPLLERSIQIQNSVFIATPLEMQIYQLYTSMFNKLFQNPENRDLIPDIAIESLRLIQKRIVNAVLSLCASIVSRKDLKKYVISSVTNNVKGLPRKTSQYSYLNRLLQKWTYQIPNLPNDTMCPICFETEVVWMFTFCGHSVCLPCLINTLADKNSCPICRSRLTIKNCMIDEASVKTNLDCSTEPEWRFKLRQFNDQVVIITDLKIDKNMTNAKVFRTGERDVGKLLKLVNIKKVIIFISPDLSIIETTEERKTDKIIDAFLDHFTLYDKPPVIERWTYVIS